MIESDKKLLVFHLFILNNTGVYALFCDSAQVQHHGAEDIWVVISTVS